MYYFMFSNEIGITWVQVLALPLISIMALNLTVSLGSVWLFLKGRTELFRRASACRLLLVVSVENSK